MTAENLPARFHQEMLRIYDEASTFGYHPTYFRRMVIDHGGVQAAKILLGKDSPSYGFERLWEARRLDISVEALVLREPWYRLFDEGELKEAERRLDGSYYQPG